MKRLVVPVPQTLTAKYLVPLTTPMTEADVRREITAAIRARLTGPLQTMLLRWIGQCDPSLQLIVAPRVRLAQQPGNPVDGRLARLIAAGDFVLVSATHRASLIAVHEWMARGAAAGLAAALKAPLFDLQTGDSVDPNDAFASLPHMTRAGSDVSISLTLEPWVSFRNFVSDGRYWAVSDGMHRFGMPEFGLGGCERDLRAELREILFGLTAHVWSDLVRRAQTAKPGSKALIQGSSAPLRVPALLNFRRKDLDKARAVPNRGGGAMEIALGFQPGSEGQNALIVCPPGYWDMGWESFIANFCHVMFGFEKPRWHYLPHWGALMAAQDSLPDVRRRFVVGELPESGQLMLRYAGPDDTFRWGMVKSWTDDVATVSDVGRELAPATKLGDPVIVKTEHIADWAIWMDGQGVVEGGVTESAGNGL